MPRLLLLNHVTLLACCSIYLGTGVSLVFFQFPLEPKMTVDNYYLIFVEPVTLATHFFTWMTIVMLTTGFVMLVTEWFTGIRWVPLVVLVTIGTATLVTVLVIIPNYNYRLAQHVADTAELRVLLEGWMALNRLRVVLWAVAWAAIAYWFYAMAWKARADR